MFLGMAGLNTLLRALQKCNESDSQAYCHLEAQRGRIYFQAKDLFMWLGFNFFLQWDDSRDLLLLAVCWSCFHVLESVSVPCHENFSIMATHFLKLTVSVWWSVLQHNVILRITSSHLPHSDLIKGVTSTNLWNSLLMRRQISLILKERWLQKYVGRRNGKSLGVCLLYGN